MFAPRVARGQKAVASSTNKPPLQHSTLAARRFAGSGVEQAQLLQGSIGSQATLGSATGSIPAVSANPRHLTARLVHRFVHDFSRIRIHTPAGDRVQAQRRRSTGPPRPGSG